MVLQLIIKLVFFLILKYKIITYILFKKKNQKINVVCVCSSSSPGVMLIVYVQCAVLFLTDRHACVSQIFKRCQVKNRSFSHMLFS